MILCVILVIYDRKNKIDHFLNIKWSIIIKCIIYFYFKERKNKKWIEVI